MVINVRCLVIVLLMMIFTGCGMQPQSDNKPNDTYSVVDDYGNVLRFDSKPKKIYAGTLSIEELLVDLVAADRFAAISEDALDGNTSLIKKKAEHVKKVVPAYIGVEAILALQPDLVIVQENHNKAFIDALKDTGLKVMVTKVPTNLDMVQKRIALIARAVGEEERGKQIINDMDKKLAVVQSKVGKIPEEKRKIAIAYSLMGAFGSKNGLFHDICIRSGLRNGAAIAGLKRGEHLSKEKIISTDPDLFIFPRYSATKKGDVDKLREDVLNDQSLQTVKAVKNKSYFIIADRYRYSASQYMADAILFMSEQAYPELYSDVNVGK